MDTTRKAHPSDVGDDEWAFVAPYLTLMREDAPQREARQGRDREEQRRRAVGLTPRVPRHRRRETVC